MILKIGFHLLAIVMALVIVNESDYLKLVVSFSLFSLFVTGIYFFNYAPDVAIAEIAIGSAIVPIMLLVSISKQRKFIVAGDVEGSCFIKEGECKDVLEEFCDLYDLDLHIMKDLDEDQLVLSGVFRVVNLDLYVKKREGTNGYFLIGKESSILMHRLDLMTRMNPDIIVILAPDIGTLSGDIL